MLCTAWLWQLTAVVVFLPAAPANGYELPSVKLRSDSRKDDLARHPLRCRADTLNHFWQLRNLSQPDWVRPCSDNCGNHQGVCNLLTGECQCPLGQASPANGAQAHTQLLVQHMLRILNMFWHCMTQAAYDILCLNGLSQYKERLLRVV